MFDALQTIMEGILNLATHGGVLVLALAVMLAIILITAWFDGRDIAARSHKRRRTLGRCERPRKNSASDKRR